MVLLVYKALWRGFQAVLHHLGLAVAAVAMSAVYLFVLGPVALVMRVTRPDPTDRGLGDLEAESYGRELEPAHQDVRRAQRPW